MALSDAGAEDLGSQWLLAGGSASRITGFYDYRNYRRNAISLVKRLQQLRGNEWRVIGQSEFLPAIRHAAKKERRI